MIYLASQVEIANENVTTQIPIPIIDIFDSLFLVVAGCVWLEESPANEWLPVGVWQFKTVTIFWS